MGAGEAGPRIAVDCLRIDTLEAHASPGIPVGHACLDTLAAHVCLGIPAGHAFPVILSAHVRPFANHVRRDAPVDSVRLSGFSACGLPPRPRGVGGGMQRQSSD